MLPRQHLGLGIWFQSIFSIKESVYLTLLHVYGTSCEWGWLCYPNHSSCFGSTPVLWVSCHGYEFVSSMHVEESCNMSFFSTHKECDVVSQCCCTVQLEELVSPCFELVLRNSSLHFMVNHQSLCLTPTHLTFGPSTIFVGVCSMMDSFDFVYSILLWHVR